MVDNIMLVSILICVGYVPIFICSCCASSYSRLHLKLSNLSMPYKVVRLTVNLVRVEK